jgi:GTPase SAR1 family protein
VNKIVYDVSKRETFNDLKTWWEEVNTYCSSPDIVKMIIGNKVDKVRKRSRGIAENHVKEFFFLKKKADLIVFSLA